jgi:putative two-component system response regulator
MTGLDFIPEALGLDPDLGIIVVTALDDVGTATRCLREGAIDFVTKPFELADLKEVVGRAHERRTTAADDRAVFRWLKQEVTRRTNELEDARRRQEELTVRALESLVLAFEARSPYFEGHAARVADLAATIATKLGLVDSEVETVRVAGCLRDLGMIGIRDDVLNKQGPLSPLEQAHVRDHVVVGARILAPLGNLAHVADIVRSHHERWDGTGYPEGLAGTAIPLAARVLHVADVFDALTSPRPYQQAVSRQEALERIARLAGRAFDPTVVEGLAWAVEQRQTLEFVHESALPTGLLESLGEGAGPRE